MQKNTDKLKLGTLEFARDWGCAKDYVRGMHMMLQQKKPDDYVLATGRAHTGKQLLETAFGAFNIKWQDHVMLDETFSRPSDVLVLVGNAAKAKENLGWTPERGFSKLILDMVNYDIGLIKKYGEINE
jgi:GDPmannose 4,6-dehydratase